MGVERVLGGGERTRGWGEYSRGGESTQGVGRVLGGWGEYSGGGESTLCNSWSSNDTRANTFICYYNYRYGQSWVRVPGFPYPRSWRFRPTGPRERDFFIKHAGTQNAKK